MVRASQSTQIGQLGAVMYEVVTGERCEFNLFNNKDLSDSGRAVWPRRENLPSVQGVWQLIAHTGVVVV